MFQIHSSIALYEVCCKAIINVRVGCYLSVMEEYLCPLVQIIFPLIEIASLMKTTSPLDQLVSRWLWLFLLRSEVSIVELLFPSFHFLNAIIIKSLLFSTFNIIYRLNREYIYIYVFNI